MLLPHHHAQPVTQGPACFQPPTHPLPAPAGISFPRTNNNQGNDGSQPLAGRLIFDTSGALYGATSLGGTSNRGAAFELTPPAAGQTQWTEAVLYNFKGGSDGAKPYAGLIFDTYGSLYGATLNGGASNVGTAFQLTPPAAGQTQWTETMLYTFLGGSDGADPYAGLIFDTSGALYGTTKLGGIGNGTVFELK